METVRCNSLGSGYATDSQGCSLWWDWYNHRFNQGERHGPMSCKWCEFSISEHTNVVILLCLHWQEGTQAIHIAAGAGYLHIMKLLVEEHGVLPDAANNVRLHYHKYTMELFLFLQDGYQPLHMAAINGQISVAEYLVMECQLSVEPVAQVYISMNVSQQIILQFMGIGKWLQLGWAPWLPHSATMVSTPMQCIVVQMYCLLFVLAMITPLRAVFKWYNHISLFIYRMETNRFIWPVFVDS